MIIIVYLGAEDIQPVVYQEQKNTTVTYIGSKVRMRRMERM